MALVGPSAHGRSTNTYSESTAAMSAAAAGLGPMPYHAATPASHPQHVILAAAAAAAAHGQGLSQGGASAAGTAAGFYAAGAASINSTSVHHQQQQPHHANVTGAQQPAQEVQPDRPIGYGAFGVVWWVEFMCIWFVSWQVCLTVTQLSYTGHQVVDKAHCYTELLINDYISRVPLSTLLQTSCFSFGEYIFYVSGGRGSLGCYGKAYQSIFDRLWFPDRLSLRAADSAWKRKRSGRLESPEETQWPLLGLLGADMHGRSAGSHFYRALSSLLSFGSRLPLSLVAAPYIHLGTLCPNGLLNSVVPFRVRFPVPFARTTSTA